MLLKKILVKNNIILERISSYAPKCSECKCYSVCNTIFNIKSMMGRSILFYTCIQIRETQNYQYRPYATKEMYKEI